MLIPTYGTIASSGGATFTPSGTTQFLLNTEGSNFQITFSDISGFGRNVFGTGPYHSTTQKKWGNSSVYEDSPQASTGLFVQAHSAYTIGTQDFTIEMWFYSAAAIPNLQILAAHFGFGSGWYLEKRGSGDGNVLRANVMGTFLVGNVVPLNTWSHIALVRHQGVIGLLQDGNVVATMNSTVAIGSGSSEVSIFNDNSYSVVGNAIGYIEDFRIHTGGSLYDPTQSTYTTPPSAQ